MNLPFRISAGAAGRLRRGGVLLLAAAACAWAAGPAYVIEDILTGASPSASRSTTWKPGDGLVLEVGGMDFLADGRLAVAIRKGEVWIIDGLSAAASGGVRAKL
ncbi:MAG: hypothetical protein ACKOTF_06900 [Opitutaceae bacterium]